MKIIKLASLLSAVSLALVTTAKADVLLGWDFDPLPGGNLNFGPDPYAATVAATSITSSGLDRGFAIGATGSGAANAWGSNNFNIVSPSFSTAISNGNFATFTVQAADGFAFSLDSVSAYNIRRSATGPSTGLWQYSLNGTDFTDIGSSITWGAITTAAGNPQSAITLSSIGALQSVTSVTFRVAIWGATATGGTWYFNDPTGTPGSDLIINGTVSAVPEPGTYAAVLGCAALVGVATRRRRHVRA